MTEKEPQNGDVITHRQIKLGDTISLDFPYLGWDRAKVVGQTPDTWQLFRPHMSAEPTGYPTIGVEIFTIWKDSDKTVVLIDRAR